MTRIQDTNAWDLAGLRTSDGYLGRSWGESGILIPGAIELTEDGLLWTYGDQWKVARPGRAMLDQFVRLSMEETTPQDILEYARRWGVLGICKHSLPYSHDYDCLPTFSIRKADCWWHSEPLKAWKVYSRRAREIANTAAKLNLGGKLTADDWQALLTQFEDAHIPRYFVWYRGSDPRFVRHCLAWAVNLWLFVGGVRPILEWRKDHWTVSITGMRGPGLYGALGCQLMLMIANSSGLTICSGCGQAYIPRRAPTLGRKHYCLQCGRRVAVRDAARRYRQRKRDGQSKKQGEQD